MVEGKQRVEKFTYAGFGITGTQVLGTKVNLRCAIKSHFEIDKGFKMENG